MSENEEGVENGLYRNVISYVGFLIAMGGAALALTTIAITFSLEAPSPYMGIFAYLLFPGIVFIGIMVILIGMWRENRRRQRAEAPEAPPYPTIDLGLKDHRRKFGLAVVGGFVLLVFFGFIGYNTFLFTESVTFCGKVCHSVMKPEHTAYQYSPHAQVPCVECHVGPGAEFFVKSKLSGIRQVFKVLTNLYPRPIPTPIENLRPARETCEECHWPKKFFGAQLMQIPYYRYDKNNTSDQISFLIKTGGGAAELGQSSGIHWHMLIDKTVQFATPDPDQQKIPWIKVTGPYGQERIYRSSENPIADTKVAKLEKHTMDCMNCHNRPSHKFPPPNRAVNMALENGNISSDLPWIKKVATKALREKYSSKEKGKQKIKNKIDDFYLKNYPKLYPKKREEIKQAAQTAVGIYSRIVFPSMNVDWKTYPVNIGHKNWPGCFRCHDGKHKTKDGIVLDKQCTTCHTKPQRGPLESISALPDSSDTPWHPFVRKGRHREILCTQCHRPGIRPTRDCAQCHGLKEDVHVKQMECSTCHLREQRKKPVANCKNCHSEPGGFHRVDKHREKKCVRCHQAHQWEINKRQACLDCHEEQKDHYEKPFCGECHTFTDGT